MRTFKGISIRLLFRDQSMPAKKPVDLADPDPPSYQLESPTHSHRAPPSPPSQGRFRWRYVLNHLMALLGSGMMIAAIVLLLRQYQDEPAPKWKEAITLNSALSWLGVLGKLALMVPVAECIGQMKWILFGKEKRKLSDLDLVDAASRDIFGAVGWIIRFRGGFLVHMGAAFVIASIGFDPAIQQLISYELRSVVDTTQTPTVSHNTNYTPVRGFDNGLILAVPRALLWGAQSSVLGDPIQPSWQCPTGNCDYPETVSVGVCQTCTDITTQIDRKCETLTPGQPFCRGKECYTTGQLCTYSYRNASVGGGQTFIDMRANPVQSITKDGRVFIPSQRIDLITLYIQPEEKPKSTQLFSLTPGLVPPGGTHVARAFSCGLSFCQHSFRASVANGKYSETITGTTQVTSFDLRIPALEEITEALISAPLAIAPDRKTNISTAALYAMSEGLSLPLTGTAKVLTSIPTTSDRISEFHRGLYENLLTKDFSTIMSEMATSMSNAIRRNTNQTSPGTARVDMIFVKVRWSWIAFPATLWLLAALLIILVTVKSYMKNTMVGWLGHSQIAALFLGLETEVRTDVDNSGVVGGRSEVAAVRSFGEKVKLRLGVVEGRGEEAIRVKFCRRGGW